jgi:hypothetical protein
MKRSVLGVALLLAACVPIPTSTAGGTGAIQVEAVAGPVCPVEQEPPDPNCEPRPVEGARIFLQPGDGRDILVGEATTDAAGRATIEIAAGDYIVVGGEVEGLMGLPDPMTVRVVAGQTTAITISYDTGIR